MSDPRHARPRVLLSSVFGPFARDDEFGSRAINPLELYHNQVTRAQGPFSLRMHHRSWGIMLIGGLSRVIDPVMGHVLLWSARRDAAVYPAGRPLEPQTFVDRRHWA